MHAVSVLAGVSISTVSRALRDDPRISHETKRRVAGLAARLGYAPNAVARGLATRSTGIVGLVTARAENYLYQEQLETMGELVAAQGRQLMLFQVTPDGDLRDVLPAMLEYRLEGAVVIASVPASLASIQACARYGVPVALINRPLSQAPVTSVVCNQFEGGRQLAQLLLAAGHERVAILAGRSGIWATQQREEGFMSCLRAGGLDAVARCEGSSSFWGAHAAIRGLLDTGPVPDAIFAVSDLMAFGAIDALRGAGLRVPDQVSVVGFDDSRLAAWPSYDLTTFAQPVRQILCRALELLLGRPKGMEAPEALTIAGHLVVRGSARLPPGLEPAARVSQ